MSSYRGSMDYLISYDPTPTPIQGEWVEME